MPPDLTARLDAATGLRILCGDADCGTQLGRIAPLRTFRVDVDGGGRRPTCPSCGRRNEVNPARLQAEWDSRRPVAGLGIRPAGDLHRTRASEAARRLAQDPSSLGPVDEERTRRLAERRDPH